MPAAQYTTGMIAHALGGELVGRSDLQIQDFAGLDLARPESMSFIRSHKYALLWPTSKAGAAVVTKGLEVPGHDPQSRALIFVADADMAIVKLLEIAYAQIPHSAPAPGMHSAAAIDPTAQIAPTARIGPFCVIGARTKVGDGCILHSHVTLGSDVAIGPQTTLHAGATVHDRCSIGAQCVLYAGSVIGSEGFGYRPDPSGRGVVRIPHVGSVMIGNQVEVGANTCVDRGKFGATVVGDGTKIDNLVQVGHNVRIGRACLICGMTGIAGSVNIGDGAVVGGQVGISDNLSIGAGAQIGALAGVISNVPPGEIWSGRPAGPHREMMRAYAALRHLSDHLREHKRTESGIAERAS